jgi:hypothetical protein
VATRRRALVPVEDISRAILVLRGHKVLLDAELAALYGVSTKRFNEQVRRNRNRFPADFMFQLTPEEQRSLRSQFEAVSQFFGRIGLSGSQGNPDALHCRTPPPEPVVTAVH